MSKEDKEIDWVYSPDDILEEWNKQFIELFIYENECLLKAADKWKNNNIKDMEKKQPTRDSKGRFMKKENKKAFDYEGAYKQQKEVIADLKKESEYYKELAERISADYLETCDKLGHIKSSLKAYETCWPKLKKLAKHWRKRAQRGEDRYLATLDYLRMAVMQIGCLRHMLPWYKKLFYRSELKLMTEEVERILSGAELLDKE